MEYRQLSKLVNKQVRRYGVLHNAKGIVENATEKAQSKLASAQNIATEKYNVIVKVSSKYLTRIEKCFYFVQPTNVL